MTQTKLGGAHTTIVGSRDCSMASDGGAGSKNVISNEIQNIDVTMTEEDIEYIRQMLEEDREILVKLS